MAKKKPRKKYASSKYKKKKRVAFWLTPSVVLVSLFASCLIFFSAIILLSSEYKSQNSEQVTNDFGNEQQFIVQTAEYAMSLKETYGILPSISIAQAILESDWGRSELSVKNNNFYGIKDDNPDKTVMMNTKEFVNGEWIEIKAPFRKYDSWQESMDEHARLIVYGTTWNENQYAAVLAATNYKDAAYALEKSGYATDPDYPGKLIRLIEEHNLNQYD